jgi:hypothetical protein
MLGMDCGLFHDGEIGFNNVVLRFSKEGYMKLTGCVKP